MGYNKKITPGQRAYILEHLNDRPRMEVARKAGVSVSTVYRLVRENGGGMDYTRDRRNPEWERIVRENYASMSGHEIERRFGITRGRANRIARDLGLRHTAETWLEIRRMCQENLAGGRRNVDWKKAARKTRAKRRLDEMRMWEGKPRLTKLRLRVITTAACRAKCQLRVKYGYHYCEGEPYTLLYDGGTRRPDGASPRRKPESYFEQKYGLRFCEADD